MKTFFFAFLASLLASCASLPTEVVQKTTLAAVKIEASGSLNFGVWGDATLINVGSGEILKPLYWNNGFSVFELTPGAKYQLHGVGFNLNGNQQSLAVWFEGRSQTFEGMEGELQYLGTYSVQIALKALGSPGVDFRYEEKKTNEDSYILEEQLRESGSRLVLRKQRTVSSDFRRE